MVKAVAELLAFARDSSLCFVGQCYVVMIIYCARTLVWYDASMVYKCLNGLAPSYLTSKLVR